MPSLGLAFNWASSGVGITFPLYPPGFSFRLSCATRRVSPRLLHALPSLVVAPASACPVSLHQFTEHHPVGYPFEPYCLDPMFAPRARSKDVRYPVPHSPFPPPLYCPVEVVGVLRLPALGFPTRSRLSHTGEWRQRLHPESIAQPLTACQYPERSLSSSGSYCSSRSLGSPCPSPPSPH